MADPRTKTPPIGTPARGGKQTTTEKIRIRLREPAKLRNLELVLLVVAIALTIGSMVLVQLGAIEKLDTGMLTLGAIPCVLALVAHVVLRVTARNADPFLLPIGLVLNGLGLAMIHRLDIAEDTTGWGGFGVRQIVWTVIAMVLAIVVLLVIRNHRVLARYRYIAMFTAILLLLLPMLPVVGQEINGARLWIHLGPFSFQPGELAKIALAVFFAGYLASSRESLSMMGKKILGIRFPRGRDLGPILVIWAAAMAVLIFQRDLGTSLLYFGLFLVMFYVATGRGSWIVLGLTLFFGGALIAANTLGYVEGRVNSWLNPFDPDLYAQGGGSYQLVQGLFGLANGGLIGTGWGLGRPDIVPLAESDYIIPSLGEELGLAGLFAILALYLLFISRGFRIGFAGQDDFGKLLGVGLSFVLALQIFVVIGGVTRVIPLTGLTTPFLAAGGSSLVANWIIVALLLRLSDNVRSEPRVGIDR
jgi:cell division protein FtsW (lipid II flippase)